MGGIGTGAAAAQYFATGKDCCKDMEFTCGESMDEAAHAGLVVFNKTQALNQIVKQDLDYYMKEGQTLHRDKRGGRFRPRALAVVNARNAWLLSSMLALPLCAVITFAIEETDGADVHGKMAWRGSTLGLETLKEKSLA
eukprot:s112_g18.t1